VTSEALLHFILPRVSTAVHSAYFLVADTPYHVILSHSTLLATGLGYTIYADHPPGSHILDASSSLEFDGTFSSLYFPSDSYDDDLLDFSSPDLPLFAIDVLTTDLEEYQYNYVQPFSDQIDTTPCLHPP